jgi:hypothetical protein
MKHLNLSVTALIFILIILISNCLSIACAQTGIAESASMVNPSNQYTISQATSNRAQLDTIAFSGLGFLTGNLTTDSFLPPGKVADFFGFQYLRDTSQEGQGHATNFLTNAANNVLSILSTDQKTKLVSAAQNQADLVNQYAYARYPLMAAFRRELSESLLANFSGLSENSVMNYSSNFFELDANISLTRALLYAQIINSLNNTQKQYLDNMAAQGFASWPSLPDQLRNTSLKHDANVLVMTYASDIFAWYAGNITSDTYFCPERQADYFGGFYLKDEPAIGQPNYTISETITGDSGAAFLSTLDDSQNALMANLVDCNNSTLAQIVSIRMAISSELRAALTSGTVNESKVIQLDREYGALDGEISYRCAITFAKIAKTLTTNQKSELIALRNELTNSSTANAKIYLYSDLIDQPSIENTDFLFQSTINIELPTSSPTLISLSNETNSPNSGSSTTQKANNQQTAMLIVDAAAILAIGTAVVLIRLKTRLRASKMTESKIKEGH